MNEHLITKQVPYYHIQLAGNAYEIGRMQAEAIQAAPGWRDYICSGRDAWSLDIFQKTLLFFDQFCPSLNTEIQGLADSLDIPVEDVIYYALTWLCAPGCSHLVGLPGATSGGQVLMARTFDYGDAANDFRLVTTRVEGKYSHIGFSIVLFGRSEGMNECGLAITTSSGGIPVGPIRPPIQDGFQFWALTRALLENCQDVDEALAMIAEFPVGGNPVYLLADKGGSAALVEIFGGHKAVRRIGPETAEKFLWATNHFNLAEMRPFQDGRMANSVIRYQVIEKFLKRTTPGLDEQKLKDLLATEYPAGLCCHYYGEYFGALHAVIFNLTENRAEICFGSPQVNPWYEIDLTSEPSPTPAMASLPQFMTSDDFWKMI